MKNYRKAVEYINKFPYVKRWINECSICHTMGYNPSMPEHIGGEESYSAYFVKKYFKPLELKDGVCSECQKLAKNKNLKF